MGNKGLKNKIESLRKQIIQHEDKIKKENIKDFPDEGMVRHLEIEIESFKTG